MMIHTSPTDRDAMTDFIEQMGLMAESDGMARIAGRIIGLLLLSDAPCDLESIAERLQVSHGSVSTNTRMLEQMGIIERLTAPGDRRVRFRIGADPAGQMLQRDLQRQQRMDALVQATLEALPPDAVGRRNLEGMHVFHTMAIRRSQEMLAEWGAHVRSSRRTATRTAGGDARIEGR